MSFSQLRPLSFGELLDGAFTLYRRHFSSLVLVGLVSVLPAIAVWLGILAAVFMSGDAAVGIYFGGIFLSWPLILLTMSLSWGSLSYFVARAYTGTPVTPRQALKTGLSRIFPLLAATLLCGIMALMGFMLCVVPGLIAAAACFAVYPALMLERRGPIDAINRSFQLVKGAWGEVALVLLVIYLIAAMPGMAVGVAGALANVAVAGNASRSIEIQAVTQLVSQMVSALVTPFSVAGVVLLYYDRRVRTEALDVQMMAESLGAPGMPGYPETPAPGWG